LYICLYVIKKIEGFIEYLNTKFQLWKPPFNIMAVIRNWQYVQDSVHLGL
jgi:hypothetical protein